MESSASQLRPLGILAPLIDLSTEQMRSDRSTERRCVRGRVNSS